jgi:hypothetical protein
MDIDKLENPYRVKELNPTGTLKKIGLGPNDCLCDIGAGAGAGIFTVPAARITRNTVYAVLHEVDDKEALLFEIKRIIKTSGRFAIIEFHAKETPMGPPVLHRLDKNTVNTLCVYCGFLKYMEFDLGDNFYCMVFVPYSDCSILHRPWPGGLR